MTNETIQQPSERLTGIRAVLSLPAAYRWAQRAIGADRFRETLVRDVLRVRAGERIVDIGCGTADILDDLPDVDYVGFDHSAQYIADAERRFGARGRFVNAAASDADLQQFGGRTLAMAIGVLHHLNDGEAHEALGLARSLLAPGGRFVSIDPTFADGQHPVGRFLASRDRGGHVRTPDATSELVQDAFPSAVVTVRHDLLRVPYSHVIVTAST